MASELGGKCQLQGLCPSASPMDWQTRSRRGPCKHVRSNPEDKVPPKPCPPNKSRNQTPEPVHLLRCGAWKAEFYVGALRAAWKIHVHKSFYSTLLYRPLLLLLPVILWIQPFHGSHVGQTFLEEMMWGNRQWGRYKSGEDGQSSGCLRGRRCLIR